MFAGYTLVAAVLQRRLPPGNGPTHDAKLFHPNRTELANQRETNGSVQTSVFSRHRVVSRRWRDDRVVASPLRGMKKKSKQRMLSAASPLWSRLIRSQWSELTDTAVPLWGTYSPLVSAAAAEPTQSGTPVCTQHCVAFSMSDSRVGITRWSLRQPPSKLSPNCFHGGFLLP